MKRNWCFEDILDGQEAKYFSLARQALCLALKAAGVGQGDVVLLPDLICADILPAITSLGGKPVYYPVDKALEPQLEGHVGMAAKAVIAVNYFGFSQRLEACRAYCSQYGAILIEDNAHGLFSRNAEGVLLGTRGDFGVFSLRKTLPLMNGAVLVRNQNEVQVTALPSKQMSVMPVSQVWRAKQLMRTLVPLIGPVGLQSLLNIGRFCRGLLSPEGESEVNSAHNGAIDLEAPYADFYVDIAKTDVAEEVKRRRALYVWVESYLQGYPCSPVFRSLGDNVVPYGYPFYAEEQDMAVICKRLKQQGLAYFSWPNLPEEVEADVPAWYKKIRVVQFLW